jgi:DNA-binding MarR family transcriptional regulator
MTEPGIPLARLLAMAYRELIDGLHEQLREQGWTDVRPAFGFVLLAAQDDGTTTSEVAELMGASKQAASKLVASMVEAGYLAPVSNDGDARRRPLRLTKRGHKLLAAVTAIYADLEARWAAEIGASEVERVRRRLTQVVASAHDGGLPPVRPTW